MLFDGDPGNYWTRVSDYDDRYLKFGTGSWTTGGSYYAYSHSHSGSGTSGAASASYAVRTDSGSYGYFSSSHTHTFNISLNTSATEPPWFRLIPYKSKVDFPVSSSPQPLLFNNVLSAI